MSAGGIWGTEGRVGSPPAFVSRRDRRSATWALVRPAGGVSTIGAAGAGGVAAAASAMPSQCVAAKGQRKARPGPRRGPAHSTPPTAPPAPPAQPHTPRPTLHPPAPPHPPAPAPQPP